MSCGIRSQSRIWALAILLVTITVSGAIRIKVDETNSSPLVLQCSSNLTDWVSLETNGTSSSARYAEFLVSPDLANAHLFYRAVKLRSGTNDLLYRKGLTAAGMIDLNGNNLVLDSFDSLDPNYSTSGRYDVQKRKALGTLSSNHTITNSLNIGDLTVYGYVCTGPNETLSLGPNGSVGDIMWLTNGQQGVQEGHWIRDMNVNFAPCPPPQYSGLPPFPTQNMIVDGIAYRFVLFSGNYEMNYLSMSSNQKLLVHGNAKLYVRGPISMSGESQIIISTNASLKLYAKGPAVDLGGRGVLNMTGFATNFCYYGLTNNTILKMVSDVTGVVYAPSAHCTLNPSTASISHFTGSLMAGSITLNGHLAFHYDESLNWEGPFRSFKVSCAPDP